MNRFISDLLVREEMARRASERAKRKKGCGCHPLSWTFEAPRIKNVRPFFRESRPSGLVFQELPYAYVGSLTQTRLFSAYEIFEIPTQEPLEAGRLEDIDTELDEHSCTLLIDGSQGNEHGEGVQIDPWAVRLHATTFFLSHVRRRVDIIRLTLAAQDQTEPPAEGPWSALPERHFCLGSGRWRVARVYEANSAGLDKGRTHLKPPRE